MPRRLLPFIALGLLLGVSAPGAARAEFHPIFFSLGVAKLPGVAFDAVGAARLQPYLGQFPTEASERAAQSAYVSNLVTLGLHGVSIGGLWLVSFLDLDAEEAMAPSFLLNAVCDLTIAVMGLATGVELLLQRDAAGIDGTEIGVGATWSAAVNITMGGFGALWFLPMTVGGLIGASEAWASLPPRSPVRALAVVPQGAGAAVVGRF
jgi:hypothetical protein